LPKYYSSSVLILVQETKTINPLAERLSYMGAPSESLAEQLKTLIQKILNYPQLVMVIEDVGLKQRAKNMMEMEQMVRTIMRHTDVRLRSAEVFEVAYEDKDPKMAQRLVNTMVKTFVNYNDPKKRRSGDGWCEIRRVSGGNITGKHSKRRNRVFTNSRKNSPCNHRAGNWILMFLC
jgi:hypothetical protein